MRNKIVVSGVILLVIGALLFVYGFFSPPRETIVNTTETIPSGGYYYYFWFELASGMSLHSEYTTSENVEFLVLDSHNFQLFEAEEDYDEIFSSWGKSQTHTFHAPKHDNFYVLLCNFGDNDVSASIKISREVSWARFVYIGGIGLSAIGFIGLIVGLILKPKMVEAPSRLLDTLKLHERMKISELASRFKTTEADVELAVIKLKSKGEPIQFDKETREVIYTPTKEE